MKKNKIIFWIATGIIFLFLGMLPLGTLLFAPETSTAGPDIWDIPITLPMR